MVCDSLVDGNLRGKSFYLKTKGLVMIPVKLSNRSIGIAFKHTQKRVKITPTHLSWKGHDAMGIERYTTCQLWDMKNPNGVGRSDFLIAEGVAKCHPYDNFTKASGRKISLTRAIDKLKLSKSDRASIWAAYLNRGTEGKVS